MMEIHQVVSGARRYKLLNFQLLQHPRWLKNGLPTKLIYSCIQMKAFIKYQHQKEKGAH